MDAATFVSKWRLNELTERSACQQHFLDLCDLVGHPKPAQADPKGEFFTFERGVTKRTGGRGWADVWKKDFFAIEYKGRHKNLDDAYDQLLLYRASLENPPLLSVCDMDRIVIRTNFTGSVEKVFDFSLEELPKSKNLDVLTHLFFDPAKLKPALTREAVTVQVAKRLGNIAQQMRERGLHPHGVARFLDRVVFCLFAEDVGLLPPDVIKRLIEASSNEPKTFFKLLTDLFKAMAKGGNFGFEKVRHFNGNLFDSTAVVEPTVDEMNLIRDAAELDWDQVDPSIFGTLFERGMDPGKRSQLGAHYTSREDIETVIDPVVIQPLRREWAVVREDVESKLAAGPPKKKTKKNDPANPISKFLVRLQTTSILDPACGSGNFLYVALQKLKDLEKEVIVFAADKGLGSYFPLVGPWQLFGIEKNQYAIELAQVSVWIGHIQWQRANGYRNIAEPILQKMTNFERKDAVLDLTDPTHPVEPIWPDAEFIVGNPPFLGGKKLRTELDSAAFKYVDSLFSVWDGRVKREADLCCYWFEKSRQMIHQGKCKRAGLIATQGIRGGANRETLKRIKATGDIFFAVSDRDWILDGANVHVAMAGFDKGVETVKSLDGSPVAKINSNLTSESDITQATRLSENLNMAFMGDTKGGSFDVCKELSLSLMQLPNPSGMPSSDVVLPWVNGLDITRRNRDQWIIDFGTRREEDASLYEAAFETVRDRVYKFRQTNNRESYKTKWWIHVEPRQSMMAALGNLNRFIVTPRVAKHRVFAWVKPPTVPDCQLIAFASQSDYFFGVLHSRPHEVWSLAQGTQVRERESGFRYTPTSCFETFPFPNPSDSQREIVSAAAKRLDELRCNWLNPRDYVRTETLEFPGSEDGPWANYIKDRDETTGMFIVRFPRTVPRDELTKKLLAKRTLTNLYNDRPTWLDLAHRELDKAVFASYGWDVDMTDEAILEALLALNFERGMAPPASSEDT
ncbi:class I SAM-dependent DNA methyltransferase [Tundrisphaera sp. TA3]|uniref:class I SAM-dependent DNA methyltransferase n=1 Tax=Tundrisphaera sp. TA3 TaxID=3435775 RepID=UPI003EBEE710